jgi:outer membrane receptor for ferrienterochelin and colicins
LNHAVLGASSVDRSQAEAERSENVSYAWNYAGDKTTITASANHTRIKNMALFLTDPNVTNGLLLAPAASAYTVDNVDLLGTWQVSARNAVTLGLEKYTYSFNATDFQGSLFPRPDYRFSMALDHTRGPLNVNVKATFTGPQNLAQFYDYADNPRYNLDGTPKLGQSPTFWVVDMHANYQWSPKVSAYFAINNVFDYKQGKVENYLMVDGNGALNVTHIWGPNLGRSVNAGVRIVF